MYSCFSVFYVNLSDLDADVLQRTKNEKNQLLNFVCFQFFRRVRRLQTKDSGEDRNLPPTSSPCLSNPRSRSSRRYGAEPSLVWTQLPFHTLLYLPKGELWLCRTVFLLLRWRMNSVPAVCENHQRKKKKVKNDWNILCVWIHGLVSGMCFTLQAFGCIDQDRDGVIKKQDLKETYAQLGIFSNSL